MQLGLILQLIVYIVGNIVDHGHGLDKLIRTVIIVNVILRLYFGGLNIVLRLEFGGFNIILWLYFGGFNIAMRLEFCGLNVVLRLEFGGTTLKSLATGLLSLFILSSAYLMMSILDIV